jgi:hypothetical protein
MRPYFRQSHKLSSAYLVPVATDTTLGATIQRRNFTLQVLTRTRQCAFVLTPWATQTVVPPERRGQLRPTS